MMSSRRKAWVRHPSLFAGLRPFPGFTSSGLSIILGVEIDQPRIKLLDTGSAKLVRANAGFGGLS
jgi:hypothetical protein